MQSYEPHGDKMQEYLTEVRMETAQVLILLNELDSMLRDTAMDPPSSSIALARVLASLPVKELQLRVQRAYDAATLAEQIRKEHSPKAAAAQEREARREEE